METFDRAHTTPLQSPEEATWMKTILRVPKWTPETCDASEYEAKSWRRRKDSILGFKRNDGHVIEGLLPYYETEYEELDEQIQQVVTLIPPGKRLERGSDLGLGGAYRGLKHLSSALVKKFFNLKAILEGDGSPTNPGLRAELELIEKAEAIYLKSLELRAAEAEKREKIKAAKRLKSIAQEYTRLCKWVPAEATKAMCQVMENPLTISSAAIMEQEIVSYIVGKAIKDLSVMRRWLAEQGIREKDLPPVPSISVPEGFVSALEKAIGRRLTKGELLSRDSRWKRQEQLYRTLDDRKELDALMRTETGVEPVPARPITYRRKPGSGKMTLTAPVKRVFRAGDTLTVTREEELPGYPNSIDGWEKVPDFELAHG